MTEWETKMIKRYCSICDVMYCEFKNKGCLVTSTHLKIVREEIKDAVGDIGYFGHNVRVGKTEEEVLRERGIE